MIKPIQAVALPPDDAVVSGVHQIANALNKRRGYSVSISFCATQTVVETAYLLVRQVQEGVESLEEMDEVIIEEMEKNL